MFDAVTTMAEQVRAGKVKAIATTGKQRSAVLPDVPTVAESGLPGYEATIWLGVLAPKATPPAVVARLNEAITKITGQAEVREAWARQGATALTMSPQAFDRYIQDDIAKWAQVIRTAKITAD
jgi:tripartite-type tricarboxylate transporter receptor subunit TctC